MADGLGGAVEWARAESPAGEVEGLAGGVDEFDELVFGAVAESVAVGVAGRAVGRVGEDFVDDECAGDDAKLGAGGGVARRGANLGDAFAEGGGGAVLVHGRGTRVARSVGDGRAFDLFVVGVEGGGFKTEVAAGGDGRGGGRQDESRGSRGGAVVAERDGRGVAGHAVGF